jgi:hypothetical protein
MPQRDISHPYHWKTVSAGDLKLKSLLNPSEAGDSPVERAFIHP